MINYPTMKKKPKRKKVDVKNRGMRFEKLIDEANAFYLANDRAVIHKKPTPVQTVNVDYPSRSKARITEAYYKTPSTTDYNGIYKGIHVDFDVKETRSKTAFPIRNIHPHQIDHLGKVNAHGGVAFLLIYVHAHDVTYLLPYEHLSYFLRRAENGRKSITLDELAENSYPINEGYRPRIDYLKALDIHIKKDASAL